MTESKRIERVGYTPGPWDVHESETLEIHPLSDEHGLHIIAEIPVDAGNKIANARLIATAPDGLELARMFIKLWESDVLFSKRTDEMDKMIATARSILKTVEGE